MRKFRDFRNGLYITASFLIFPAYELYVNYFGTMLDPQKLREHRGLAVIVIPPKSVRSSAFHMALISEYGTLGKGDFIWHFAPADPLLTRQRFPAWGETCAAIPGDTMAVLLEPGQKSALTISLATLRSTVNDWTEKGAYELPVSGAQVATWSTYRLNARQSNVKKLQTTVHAPHDGNLIAWLEENLKNKKALKPYAGDNLGAMAEVINAHHRFDYLNENQLFAADRALMPGILREAAAAQGFRTGAAVKTWRYEGCVKFAEETKAGDREEAAGSEEEEDGGGGKALNVAPSSTDSDDGSDSSRGDDDDSAEDDPKPAKRIKMLSGKARGVGGGTGTDEGPRARRVGSRVPRTTAAVPVPGVSPALAFMSPTAARLTSELAAKKTRQSAPESREDLLQMRLDAAQVTIFSTQAQLATAEGQVKLVTELAEQLKKDNKRLCNIASGLAPSIQQSIMAHCANRTPGELSDLDLYDAVPLERRQDVIIAFTACLGDEVTEQFLFKVLSRAMNFAPLDTSAVVKAVLKVLPDKKHAEELGAAWSVRNLARITHCIATYTPEDSPVQKALLAVLVR